MAAMTVPAAALDLKVSTSTLRRWIKQGAPVAVLGRGGPGGGHLVDVAAIRAWRNGDDAQAALVAFAGRVPQLIATAAAESLSRCPNKYAGAWALCYLWQSASLRLLDELRRAAPAVPLDLEVVPEEIERLKMIAMK